MLGYYMPAYVKTLIFIAISFWFFGCTTFFQKSSNTDNIQNQASSKEPGCSFNRELYDTLESIISTNVSTEEDSDFADIEDSPKEVTSAFTHTLLDLEDSCGVKSKLRVYSSKKGLTKYTLVIYKNNTNKSSKSKYKESFTITTNSARELLKKTRTLFPEEN